MRKITARFFETDKEAGTRAGWQFQREGDRLPALELAHMSRTAGDSEILAHAEFEYGTVDTLEVIR